MIRISDFEPQFAVSLPDTYSLLATANLVVHPDVSNIVLHGSRGPAGGQRLDSDIDLSLIVDRLQEANPEYRLHEVSEATLRHWQSSSISITVS